MIKALLFSVWFLFHPVHVTITSIDYVPEISSFKVFVRIYFDDFLLDCKLHGGDIQNKDFTVSNSASMEVMERYLGEMVSITVNEKPLSGKLKNMLLTDNEISMNLEYVLVKKPETVTVRNLLLTGMYSDQSNMVIVRVNDFEEGVKLTPDQNEMTFRIK
ncbi:MAG: hypothetical protein LLG13_05195 [Bacteroidales bacterium]|nr:hypothetical protein [Bacteroidales bacterium]